jgi:uncharacterized protein YprB with RNaseH-like and TPR domain
VPPSMSRSTMDHFPRLKALQPPTSLRRPEQVKGFEENEVLEDSLRRASGAAIGSDRLAHILGAGVKRNRHGEHLSLHCWHGGHAPCSPDAAALRLLAPDSPQEVLDAEQWLFLDTETTGLMGGTGTYLISSAVQWADRIMRRIDGVFGSSPGDGR